MQNVCSTGARQRSFITRNTFKFYVVRKQDISWEHMANLVRKMFPLEMDRGQKVISS